MNLLNINPLSVCDMCIPQLKNNDNDDDSKNTFNNQHYNSINNVDNKSIHRKIEDKIRTLPKGKILFVSDFHNGSDMVLGKL